jgi:hypothetical protein
MPLALWFFVDTVHAFQHNPQTVVSLRFLMRGYRGDVAPLPCDFLRQALDLRIIVFQQSVL